MRINSEMGELRIHIPSPGCTVDKAQQAKTPDSCDLGVLGFLLKTCGAAKSTIYRLQVSTTDNSTACVSSHLNSFQVFWESLGRRWRESKIAKVHKGQTWDAHRTPLSKGIYCLTGRTACLAPEQLQKCLQRLSSSWRTPPVIFQPIRQLRLPSH